MKSTRTIRSVLSATPWSRFRTGNCVDLQVIQTYLFYILTTAVVAFCLSSGDRGIGTIASVVIPCFVLCGLYTSFLIGMQSHAAAAIGVLVALLLLPLAPFLRYLLGAVGCVGIWCLMREWRSFSIKNLLALPVFFIVLYGSSIQSDFDYLRYLNQDDISIDSYFHIAISAMYKNFGVTSIGLDGLVPIAYHTLSHKVLAGISVLSQESVMATYARMYFVLGPALLVFVLAALAIRIQPRQTFDNALLNITVLMLAVRCLPVFKEFGFWDSYISSESFLLSLVLLGAAFLALIKFRDDQQDLFCLCCTFSLLIFSGISKASVGVLGFCVFGLFGLFALRTPKFWLALLAGAAMFLILILEAASSGGANVNVRPLDFVDQYAPAFGVADGPIKTTLFFLVHFLPVWGCLIFGFLKKEKNYMQTNEFLVLIGLLLPALGVISIFQIAGGSAFYFSSVPVIFALSFAAGHMALPRRSGWSTLLLLVGLFFVLNFGGAFDFITWGLVKLFFLAALLLLLSNFGSPYKRWVAIFFLVNVGSRMLAGAIEWRTTSETSAKIDVSSEMAQLLSVRHQLPQGVAVRFLSADVLTASIGCKAYWAVPAILERPIVGGLPGEGWCEEYKNTYYGLSDYKNPHPKPVQLKEFVVKLE